MASYKELVYWHENSYGNALRIPKRALCSAIIFLCIVTPFTNWMIPFAPRFIKEDVLVRY